MNSDKNERPGSQGDATEKPARNAPASNWLQALLHMGLGEGLLRVGTHLLSILMVILVVVLLQRLAPRAPAAPIVVQSAFEAQPTATPRPETLLGDTPKNIPDFTAIRRRVLLHTNVPTRPRLEVIKYTVQSGDSVFGIAEKFGLSPQTILWGNFGFLFDDPHRLRPGQELNILPVNGTYYEWNEGDGLNGVAEFFGVDPQVIINFPGNHLDPETIGDLSAPNIAAGTWLIIPGGTRAFTSWQAPFITRSDPTAARVIGAGFCGTIYGGQVGYGSFIWPTNRHYLSGYDYSEETNHRGIDIAGREGEPIYAADAGVIVYAGWNDYGYGNMVMIDHGEWQTLYAHMSEIYVQCGQGIGRGESIGAIGSTGNSSGPHLHFEMMHLTYGKVNPWNFLPPP